MKPYQKKITRQPIKGRSHKPWTDGDRARLRTMYEQGATYATMSRALGRSLGSINGEIYNMKKRDEAERFVHVVEQDLNAIEAIERKGNASVRPVNLKKYPLTSSEMDGKLKQFRLYEGMYTEPKDDPQPSLWQRVRAFFKL